MLKRRCLVPEGGEKPRRFEHRHMRGGTVADDETERDPHSGWLTLLNRGDVRESLLILDLPDNPARIPGREDALGNVPCDHAAGADDRS
jgi:hypothetical protein